MLSDGDLLKAMRDQGLVIDPYDPSLLQPSSIDLRLDKEFQVISRSEYPCIDPSQEQPHLYRKVVVPDGEPFHLHSGDFVLGCTYEKIAVPDHLVARIEGRSSLGRIGLQVHATAGFVDPGFRGQLTLELTCVAPLPIMLWPGMKIAQLAVFPLSSPALHPYGAPTYGSHYQGQRGPTPARAWRGWRTWPLEQGQQRAPR